MSDRKKIDYSKFKCEVYSSEGSHLMDATFNKDNNFYCPGLTPGQKYYVVFSYDNIFLECWAYTCPVAGKVVYISPGHIVFNHGFEAIPGAVLSSIRIMIDNAKSLKLPRQRRVKHALDAFIESTHEGAKKMICTKQIFAFTVGMDLNV
ncbi:MAG: hypothetical protein A2275_17135 [Bacteroidetes bacterium RIFOXYA12_FULL_35_11]|nr:MAG: hypothetical protein A2X01_07395 [Bacteroidetes bacterium GWF2_35_48]OFY83413.1 MAG: hypothetical protein A2275_17135 [Bacteroidetes bacterium RIFOXYA12_FULL_35_11]OFY95940.1 MAG: hypothetical protein A2309_09225 [Bacteroidetes bacterium RIFOXYB2_FULL_35_7]OFY97622.1 MAG: hypothetical protein A2491_03295 [Bacteroidetes bacterium RIFOXYC12_FULL_35_7]HBX50668.1 hypothetical protein [Bacteroidales bacterium]